MPPAHTGGSSTLWRNCSIGEWGATKGAKMASRAMKITTMRPATAPRFSEKADQNAFSGETSGGTVSISDAAGVVSRT